MKKILFVIVFCFILFPLFAQSNVTIKDVATEVNELQVRQTVESLENFGTRFMLAPNRFEVAGWIKGQFESMGFTDVKLDSFRTRTIIGPPFISRQIDTVTTQVNVVATIEGSISPEDIYIICGHYDSFCDNANVFKTAPGADDNASGTTAVMEVARAVKNSGYIPPSTLKFIALAAEELMYFGDSGSEVYASAVGKRGDNIKFVVNNDMIGYNKDRFYKDRIYISPSSNFQHTERLLNLANSVSSLQVLTDGYNGADLAPFISNGFTGVYFEEAIFNEPNYHKSSDKTDKIDFTYITEVIKMNCAVLLGMDENITGIKPNETLVENFILYQNYPNPFNPSTKIEFSIPNVGTSRDLSLQTKLIVYDILGREVKNVLNKKLTSGSYEVEFDGTNLPSGVYIYRLITGTFSQTKKMLLMK